jgi:DNA-binding NarL/FixJ family response regulator
MLPDSQGQDSLKALAGRFPQIPVVVLTRLEDEDTVLASLKSGAQDYLIKGKLTSELLDHALTFAIRRHKLLMAEFQSLSAVSKPPRTPLTAVMFGVTSLKTELPDVFQTFQKEYMGVLEMVLEERAYKVEHDVTEGLRSIAERLGYIKATPRDVVDVHSAALKELTDRASFQKVEALVKEGRWTLLQLMGYLASYYRNYSLGGIRSAAPQHGAGEDLEEESQDDGAR